MELRNKIAVVTGGSKGIGRAIAAAFIGEGAHVAISARNADELQQTAKEIHRDGATVLPVPADVRDPDSVRTLEKMVREKLGPAHILVNNAGIGKFDEVA